MLRSYRVILEVDIEVESEDEAGFEGVEERLEDSNIWYVSCDDFDFASVNSAEVDSFDIGWGE